MQSRLRPGRSAHVRLRRQLCQLDAGGVHGVDLDLRQDGGGAVDQLQGQPAGPVRLQLQRRRVFPWHRMRDGRGARHLRGSLEQQPARAAARGASGADRTGVIAVGCQRARRQHSAEYIGVGRPDVFGLEPQPADRARASAALQALLGLVFAARPEEPHEPIRLSASTGQ